MSVVRHPAGRWMRTARQHAGSRRFTRKPIAARSLSRSCIDMSRNTASVFKRPPYRRVPQSSGRPPPERGASRHRCGDMADRSRLTPLFGALIATAATLYAATRASDPLREERITPARPGWWRILANTWTELDRDHVSIMAAGIAFYALLSIFPGMSPLISIYGLA